MSVIRANQLICDGIVSTASSYTTASVAPGVNALELFFVINHVSNPTTPTVSGAGVTWTQVESHVSGTSYRVTLFRALSASPGSGILTIDFGGQTQGRAAWELVEFYNIDTSGSNGANAIVQYISGVGTSLTPSLTLGAFSNINNATFGVMSINGLAGLTAGANFTELANNGTFGTEAQWANNNQTTVNWTNSQNNDYGAIAVELKAALGTFRGGMI